MDDGGSVQLDCAQKTVCLYAELPTRFANAVKAALTRFPPQ